jgi:hypothetical protein
VALQFEQQEVSNWLQGALTSKPKTRDKDLKLQNKAFGLALALSLMLLCFKSSLPPLGDIR